MSIFYHAKFCANVPTIFKNICYGNEKTQVLGNKLLEKFLYLNRKDERRTFFETSAFVLFYVIQREWEIIFNDLCNVKFEKINYAVIATYIFFINELAQKKVTKFSDKYFEFSRLSFFFLTRRKYQPQGVKIFTTHYRDIFSSFASHRLTFEKRRNSFHPGV